MRTIKFRAWDTLNKKMYLNPINSRIGNINQVIFAEHGDWEYMQFTGLLDAKGKEIYEGDILHDEYNRTLLVEWFGCCYTLKAISKTNFVRAWNINQWFEDKKHFPEVIGNIYQDSHLIIQPKDI